MNFLVGLLGVAVSITGVTGFTLTDNHYLSFSFVIIGLVLVSISVMFKDS